jgi:hypothetical protein
VYHTTYHKTTVHSNKTPCVTRCRPTSHYILPVEYNINLIEENSTSDFKLVRNEFAVLIAIEIKFNPMHQHNVACKEDYFQSAFLSFLNHLKVLTASWGLFGHIPSSTSLPQFLSFFRADFPFSAGSSHRVESISCGLRNAFEATLGPLNSLVGRFGDA